MAPTEETILANFLLPPASLPSVMPFSDFALLFPPAVRAQHDQQLRRLYRDLQHQRGLVTDGVAAAIADEVRRGERQRRAAVRARRAAAQNDDLQDEEADVEHALFGDAQSAPARKPHTITTILPQLRDAMRNIEAEINELEDQHLAMMDEINDTVLRLSDLRYGRFANPDLNPQVLELLQTLDTECEKK